MDLQIFHKLLELTKNRQMSDFKTKSEEYWKKKLTPQAFKVLREKGTETPFSGKYYNNLKTGMYVCAACGQELFSSKTKFDSGSGWPSFDNPVNRENVNLIKDYSLGLIRTEVNCRNCGSHLGHVFDDGPKETTGKRYCINSCSLDFKPDKLSP
jgi:peptide-methionine (R)-S-oxide reductase